MKKKFGTLIDIAKYEKGVYAINFYAIFLFKRLVYAMILIAGFKWFALQVVLLTISTVIVYV